MGGDGEQRWPVVAESAAKSKELEKLKTPKNRVRTHAVKKHQDDQGKNHKGGVWLVHLLVNG